MEGALGRKIVERIGRRATGSATLLGNGVENSSPLGLAASGENDSKKSCWDYRLERWGVVNWQLGQSSVGGFGDFARLGKDKKWDWGILCADRSSSASEE